MKCVSVFILTYNEEQHIARAIQSVSSFAQQIFVIDSFSQDKTVDIARAMGATVLQNRFINHAKQFQWALDNAPIEAPWTMRLDADEFLSPELSDEICSRLEKLSPEVTGVNLKRQYKFLGRRIKYGGRHELILLRIWRSGRAFIENRWMDEHVLLRDPGKLVTFNAPFLDENLNDLTFFTEKHNHYATREAVDIINQKYRLFDCDRKVPHNSFQASAKRFIKVNIYNRIPFQISTLSYFLYRYIIRLGFLDGCEGLTYHFLQGYWYRFLVGAKAHELERALAPYESRQEKLKELARLTKLDLVHCSSGGNVSKQ